MGLFVVVTALYLRFRDDAQHEFSLQCFVKDNQYLSVSSCLRHSDAESSRPSKGQTSYHPGIRVLQRLVPRAAPFVRVGFGSFA